MLDLTVIPRATVRSGFKDTQAIVEFSNGYQASIIKDGYGKENGKYELAVLVNGEICYTSPITDDVLGYLSEQEVLDMCAKIAQLPSIEE